MRSEWVNVREKREKMKSNWGKVWSLSELAYLIVGALGCRGISVYFYSRKHL